MQRVLFVVLLLCAAAWIGVFSPGEDATGEDDYATRLARLESWRKTVDERLERLEDARAPEGSASTGVTHRLQIRTPRPPAQLHN